MSGACKLCSGIQAQIKAAEGDIEEIKKEENTILAKIEEIRKDMVDGAVAIRDAISKKPSTAVLIGVFAIVVTLFGTIATIGYWAHQNRMARLEDANAAIQKQINIQYATIGNRLQGIEAFSKRQDQPKAAIKK